MTMKSKFTEDQMIEIWNLHKNKMDRDAIAEKLNIYPSIVGDIIMRLSKYIEGKSLITDQTTTRYKNVIARITQEKLSNSNGQLKKQEDLGEFTQDVAELEKAFDNLKDAVVEFIVKAADKRAVNIVKAKEKELSDQKEKYEQELLKMQSILAEAKNSSITGLLKRKWTELS